jgi:hypothetical protein
MGTERLVGLGPTSLDQRRLRPRGDFDRLADLEGNESLVQEAA